MNDDLTNLKNEIAELRRQYQLHKHLGTDLTQPISTTATQNVYGGRVDAPATSSILPSGWTASVSAGNVYTITHNLASTNYTVVAIAYDSNAFTYYIPNIGFNSNNFQIDFDTLLGVAGKTDWTFILKTI